MDTSAEEKAFQRQELRERHEIQVLKAVIEARLEEYYKTHPRQIQASIRLATDNEEPGYQGHGAEGDGDKDDGLEDEDYDGGSSDDGLDGDNDDDAIHDMDNTETGTSSSCPSVASDRVYSVDETRTLLSRVRRASPTLYEAIMLSDGYARVTPETRKKLILWLKANCVIPRHGMPSYIQLLKDLSFDHDCLGVVGKNRLGMKILETMKNLVRKMHISGAITYRKRHSQATILEFAAWTDKWLPSQSGDLGHWNGSIKKDGIPPQEQSTREQRKKPKFLAHLADLVTHPPEPTPGFIPPTWATKDRKLDPFNFGIADDDKTALEKYNKMLEDAGKPPLDMSIIESSQFALFGVIPNLFVQKERYSDKKNASRETSESADSSLVAPDDLNPDATASNLFDTVEKFKNLGPAIETIFK